MIVLNQQERMVVLFIVIVAIAGAAINYAVKRSACLKTTLCFDPSYGKININTADAQQLKDIPGVGDTLAARIIDHRQINGPFRLIEDLKNIKGFSGARFERLRSSITVE